METKAKVKIVCSYCDSENVTVDAWARWDVESQQWELGEVFQQTYCEDCGGECNTVQAAL